MKLIVLNFLLIFIQIVFGDYCPNNLEKPCPRFKQDDFSNNDKLSQGQQPNKIKCINGSGNKLEKLHKDIFQGFTELKTIDLRSNQITRLIPGTFDNQTDLKSLYLQNNNLTVLENDLFAKNRKLECVHLQFNKIVAVGPTVFKNIKNDAKIFMEGNICSNSTKYSGKYDSDDYKKCHEIYPKFTEIFLDNQEDKNLCNDIVYILLSIIAFESIMLIIFLIYFTATHFNCCRIELKEQNDIKDDEIGQENPEPNYVELDLAPGKSEFVKKDEVIYTEVRH
jgi:Leucine-rich repeat (LRR) protein